MQHAGMQLFGQQPSLTEPSRATVDEPSIRAAFSQVSGPHPLDASTIELRLYAVGWAFVLRDLQTALPPPLAAVTIEALRSSGVERAFEIRDNLVNADGTGNIELFLLPGDSAKQG